LRLDDPFGSTRTSLDETLRTIAFFGRIFALVCGAIGKPAYAAIVRHLCYLCICRQRRSQQSMLFVILARAFVVGVGMTCWSSRKKVD
jgi:hypothetical protein